MAVPRLNRLSGCLLALTVLAELVAVPLSWGLEPAWNTLLYAVGACAFAGTGALILERHPRHVIGWLLLSTGLVSAVAGDLAQGWALRAAAEGWPGGPPASALVTASWLVQGPAFAVIILLFPTDRLPGRRWRYVVGLAIVGAVVGTIGWVLDPGTGTEYASGTNPYAVDSLPTRAMFVLGFTVTAGVMVAAFVAAAFRFRASSGVERQQLKWFALSTGLVVVTLPLAGWLWFVTPFWPIAVALALTLWPITIGVAVLRYRLYDVDLVISRAFAYVALTAAVAAVFAAAVVVLGALVGGGETGWVTAAATLAAAAAFQVLHRRVQDRVDRRLRPERHRALGYVTRFVEELRHDRAEPEDVVDALRLALGDPGLDLVFWLQSAGPPGEQRVDTHGRPAGGDEGSGRERVPVRRSGIVLGEVVWSPPTDRDRALLPGVLVAAGLPIEMARLRVELRKRLAEVDASRARIAAVADEERRRLERDLHDGAQQRLVSIGLALRHAQHQTSTDPPAAAETLDGAVAEIGAAIDELRALAQGLRPSLLQAGLGPALRHLASRSPVPVLVTAGTDRYPPDLEAAAYFVACEALTNAVKHARAGQVVMHVAEHRDTLVVRVADDGVGGAALGGGSGLTGMSDRVAARGGRLLIESAAGQGTTLHVELPCVS